MPDAREKQQKEAQIDKLRKEIGNDAFDGLAALAECRHDSALNKAGKAQASDNPNYALAGLWLEVLSYADQRKEQQARNLFPKVVEKDWNIKNESQAEEAMRKAEYEKAFMALQKMQNNPNATFEQHLAAKESMRSELKP